MAEFLEQFGRLVQEIIAIVGYPGVTAIMLLENLFPPTPSEVIMPFVGFMVGRGELTFVGVWLAAVAGAVIGSFLLYLIGAWADERIVRALLRRCGRYVFMSEADLDKALGFFTRYGDWIVLLVRLIPLPLVRPTIALVAGINHMAKLKFVAFTALGAGVWIAIWLAGGVFLGNNWRILLDFLSQYEEYTALAAIGLGVMILGALYVVWRRRMNRTRAGRQPLTAEPSDPT